MQKENISAVGTQAQDNYYETSTGRAMFSTDEIEIQNSLTVDRIYSCFQEKHAPDWLLISEVLKNDYTI